jgi:putative nucleotide binding protein
MGFNEARTSKKFEDFAYVLDFLPQGKVGRDTFKADPIVQLVGESYFTLLEATTHKNITPILEERMYIGKEIYREKISHILGRITYEDLTAVAKTELPSIVETIVKRQEGKFIEFINQASAITPRMHSLELLPGIGKKYMWNILRVRERTPLTSFEDMKNRTEIPDPVRLIVKRILVELSEESKYRLFTRPP